MMHLFASLKLETPVQPRPPFPLPLSLQLAQQTASAVKVPKTNHGAKTVVAASAVDATAAGDRSAATMHQTLLSAPTPN